VGDQIHLDRKFPCLLRKDESGKKVTEGVLLPVNEVLFRSNFQGVRQHGGTAVWSRTEPDDLRHQRKHTVVSIGRLVMKSDADGHALCPSRRSIQLKIRTQDKQSESDLPMTTRAPGSTENLPHSG